MQAETLHVSAQRLVEAHLPGHCALHRQHLLAGARAEGDAVSACSRLQRAERAGLVRITVVVSHAGGALLLDQRAAPGEQLHRAGDDLVQHRLQRLIGWRGHVDEDGLTVGAAPAYAVQLPAGARTE